MKIKKSSFYRTLFVVVLLSQIYLPSFKTNIFFQLAVLTTYFSLEKPKISLRLIKTMLPVVSILLLGFLGMWFYHNPAVFALKDIFHFIKPLQGMLIGYFFFKTINNNKIFIKSIVITGFISALIHFLILLCFTDLAAGTVNALRVFTKDNFLELFALFFLGYYKVFFHQDLFESKKKSRVIFIILLLSCLLYFSRTMIVGGLILFFSIKGYTKITTGMLKYIGLAIIATGLLYGYLYSIKIDRSAQGIEAFIYKIKIAPEELFKTKINRENHADLWDHWRGYEAKRAFALMEDKPLSYLFGTGYGSRVNLKFKAPLASGDDNGMKFISELHNGYPYVLYKTGIIGLALYLYFLLGLYKRIYTTTGFETIFISALGLFYLFTTLTITGIYNTSDTTVFILGALLFGLEKSHKNEKL